MSCFLNRLISCAAATTGVFGATATTVGYELTVEDTATGALRRHGDRRSTQVYRNPDRHPAATITDTQAFATCL